jgi:hypothetical protein
MTRRLRITETELVLFYHGTLALSEVLSHLQENDRLSRQNDGESKLWQSTEDAPRADFDSTQVKISSGSTAAPGNRGKVWLAVHRDLHRAPVIRAVIVHA